MLNLFILVILQQFDEYYLASSSPIASFKSYLEQFKEVWSKLPTSHGSLKLKETFLVDFLMQLESPLGMLGNDKKEALRCVLQMQLRR
jgi:hypothetical protein